MKQDESLLGKGVNRVKIEKHQEKKMNSSVVKYMLGNSKKYEYEYAGPLNSH